MVNAMALTQNGKKYDLNCVLFYNDLVTFSERKVSKSSESLNTLDGQMLPAI